MIKRIAPFLLAFLCIWNAQAQQKKVSTAMTGMASQTGRRGEAESPPMTRPAIGARNNI